MQAFWISGINDFKAPNLRLEFLSDYIALQIILKA